MMGRSELGCFIRSDEDERLIVKRVNGGLKTLKRTMIIRRGLLMKKETSTRYCLELRSNRAGRQRKRKKVVCGSCLLGRSAKTQPDDDSDDGTQKMSKVAQGLEVEEGNIVDAIIWLRVIKQQLNEEYVENGNGRLDKFEGWTFDMKKKIALLSFQRRGPIGTMMTMLRGLISMSLLLCIIDKLHPSWKDFKHTLKHKKEELTLVELGSHLRIEESLRMQDSVKDQQGNNVAVLHCPIMDDDVAWWVDSGATAALTRISTIRLLVAMASIHNLIIHQMNVKTSFLNDKMVYLKGNIGFRFVRLPDPKLKTLGKRGIECIFVRYVENSKTFRFYVIEPNELVLINSLIESRDAIFDENRFSLVPRPSLRIPNGTKDIGGSVVPKEVTKEVVTQQPKPETRKGKRNRTPKNFRLEFQLYLIEVTMDEVYDQHSYWFNVKDDPKTFDEAMKSHDVAFWKEAINDEMNSIMGNNTWVLADLPPGCKPLCYKWIFKRKLKVDGTIEKLKDRLVIQGFRQNSGLDYLDTHALMARISTIRLLITLASINSLIIHQMDVKTAFLNGELDEEVDMTNECLSSRFFMRDMGEADVIFGIRIKHESNRIAISLSHYVEKVLKKFNYFDCTPVSTPIDTSEKLMLNNGHAVSQLEYYRVICYMMCAMTCTRPDIA
ncbi:zinc finger, CCHC-type containing protein, partial [Tanacetum coccineum]